ncbi:hypothetical protein MUP59_00370, partial [Candidatus Bathyarchaeota archaeon]|nr:hypothetical protein [Candidatus Bathyarchaeota archaeon]
MAGEIYTIQDLVKSISVRINTDGKYRRFQRMYSKDRIAFVYDIMPKLGLTIAPYQVEILGFFDEGYTRVAVRSPHGSGKTTLASVLTHHAILTAEADCKVPTTASAWRQLEKYLWPEIRKSEKMIDWVKVGRDPYDHRTEFLQLSIRLRGGLVEAFALSSDDEQTIEGAHATRLMYIFDEAKAIPRKTWDAAEGAFANANVTTQADIKETMLNIDEYADESIITQAIEQNQSNAPKSIPGIAVYDVLAGRKNKVYNPNTNRLIVPERDSNVFSGHGIGSVSANGQHMSVPVDKRAIDSQIVQRDQSIVPSVSSGSSSSSPSSGSSLLLPVRSQLSDS